MASSQKRKLGEIVGFVIVFLSVILLLSFLTYNPEDPSANVGSTRPQTSNFIGRTGAWVSDFCFGLFGLAAYILLIPFWITAYKLIANRGFFGYFAQWLGVFTLLFAVSGLCDIFIPLVPERMNFTPGGIVGGTLKALLVYYLNRGGATLLLGAAFISGVMLLTPKTLDELAGKIGQLYRGIFHRRRRPVPAPVPPDEAPLDDGPGEPAGAAADPPPEQPVPPEQLEPYVPAGWNARPDADPPPSAALARPERPAEEPPVQTRAYRPETPPPLPPPMPARKPPEPTARAEAKPGFRIPITPLELRDDNVAEPEVAVHTRPHASNFRLPPLSLLAGSSAAARISESELMDKAQQIIRKYQEFGIDGSIDAIHPGPVVTLFEFKPAPGMKYSRIVGLVDDLCLGLKAESLRIDRIPGKSTIGIEVPNSQRQVIQIRDVVESKEFQNTRSRLLLALGKKINGDVFVTDLTKMPHLLVAGATGSGKSVGLNTMITSILYKATPEEVKFIFIDPKRLELGMYADIPHLLTPIVTDAKMAANTLLWAVHEMEERYKLLANYSVRDIESFNRLTLENDDLENLPFIVIIIDELAELLSVASKEVELCLQRLAQMARAVGIHIIIATQRPSVEIVTGVIKANFPSRISFRLLSKHDSKTILDTVGAEHLLGKGDMLILPPNSAKMIRVHGAYITEEETKALVDFLKGQQEPAYQDLVPPDVEEPEGEGNGFTGDDPLFDEVARFVVKNRKASTSVLQRRFRIGYGRAARLMDMLEEEGLIGQAVGSRPREVLVPPNYFDEIDQTNRS